MQTPLLLVDNVFDTVSLYPSAVLDAASETAGREAYRAVDYRRDRTWWQPSDTDGWLRVDLGVGGTRGVDYLFIDRGHNLWNRVLFLEGNDDGVTWTASQQSFTVPALGTVGGDPTWPNVAVTEEGALYSLRATTFGPRRWWRIRDGASAYIPIVTGVMAGLKTQLLGYSAVYDEDAGERTQAGETSRAGYRGAAMTYSWRTCDLDLRLIGSTEYDNTIRETRRLLFAKNQPAVVFMDYGAYSARGWMYQLDGAAWAMPKSRVYRGGRIRLREVGALLP